MFFYEIGSQCDLDFCMSQLCGFIIYLAEDFWVLIKGELYHCAFQSVYGSHLYALTFPFS